MTAEFGPRNVDLSATERVSAATMRFLFAVADTIIDEQGVRFNDQTATLSVRGESDQPGDGFKNGRLVSIWGVVNALIPIGLLILLGEIPIQAGLLPASSLLSAVYSTLVLLPLAVFAMVNAHGSISLLDKIDVIDHTTPKPDDRIEELADGYVDGQIDREEFAAEVETLFEREGER